ncbi:low molecular weight phosphatase family protein [Microbacterium sp. Sa4CUA7]|uniref:Low molecular weight phosphatase family protein n=1 Tax=Microbacterium pullorum TaxID=2762236 RepID=A0ABR8S515_9MICO|nr:low molecular weight phosphatase family protein [Microbacterium pullorum]MBD7958569.1 low molecular weight phosphatase family protein [Microbacterium pullorum]
MFEIITVCTGNICRSPLAEQLLRTRLAGLPGTVNSGGTYDMGGAEMPAEAQRLAAMHGVPAQLSAEHRSQTLTSRMLASPDLILAMAREHRRAVVELAPARLRSTFTLREFARLAADTTDAEIVAAADGAGTDASARLRAAVASVAAHRGVSLPPADPADDDVIDPYRRSWNTYELSGSQLVPAIDQVVRVVRTAIPA